MEPFLESLPSDIFSGQIIASLIVLAFLAIFLLREWIQQNARPGIFEEVQPEPALQLEAIPVPPLVAPEPAPGRAEVPGGRAELEIDGGNAHPGVDPTTETDEDDIPPRPLPDVPEDVRATDPSSSSSSDTEKLVRRYHTVHDRQLKEIERIRRAKAAAMTARRHSRSTRRLHSEREEDDDVLEAKRHQRRRRFESSETPVTPVAGPSYISKAYSPESPSTPGNSLTNFVSASKGKGRAADVEEITDDTHSASNTTERESFSPPSDFEFTFSAPQRAFTTDASNSRTSSPEVEPLFDPGISPSGSVSFGSKILRPSFDYPLSDQNKRNLPSTDLLPTNDVLAPNSSIQTPRRPPLASTSLALADLEGDASGSKPPSLVSPSLATYRPPEDFRDDDDVDYFEQPVDATRLPDLADADDEDEIEEARSADELKQEGAHADSGPHLLPDTDEDDEDEDPRNDRRNFRAIQVEFRQPLNPPARPGAAQQAEVEDEDREQNLDEDFDGALEGTQ